MAICLFMLLVCGVGEPLDSMHERSYSGPTLAVKFSCYQPDAQLLKLRVFMFDVAQGGRSDRIHQNPGEPGGVSSGIPAKKNPGAYATGLAWIVMLLGSPYE